MPPSLPPMPPPILAYRKKRSGCAMAAIVLGVIVAVIVVGLIGTFTFLAKEGSGDVPAWLKYPDGTLVTSTTMRLPGVFEHTTMQYQTDDSVERVAEYYKAEIAKHGGQATAQQDDMERLSVHRIVVKSVDDKLEVNIMKPKGRPTGMFIQYSK